MLHENSSEVHPWQGITEFMQEATEMISRDGPVVRNAKGEEWDLAKGIKVVLYSIKEARANQNEFSPSSPRAADFGESGHGFYYFYFGYELKDGEFVAKVAAPANRDSDVEVNEAFAYSLAMYLRPDLDPNSQEFRDYAKDFYSKLKSGGYITQTTNRRSWPIRIDPPAEPQP